MSTTPETNTRGIQYEQVAAAIEEIRATGQNPTLRGIRDYLGTGSLGTIQRHLKRWQEEKRSKGEPEVALPEALKQALTQEIERQRAEVRGELEEALTEAQRAAEELSEANEALEGELTAFQREAENQKLALAEATGRIEQLERELERAREATQNVQHLAAEQQSTVAALKAQAEAQQGYQDKLEQLIQQLTQRAGEETPKPRSPRRKKPSST